MSVPPTHRVGFVDSDSIASIAYSTDSKEIYVALSIESVNVWQIMVEHWPYAFGAPALLMALAGAFLLRGVIIRPRRKNRSYCRRCNHEVGDRTYPCPECGTPLDARRKVVKGKSFRRRTWPAFTLLTMAAIGYGTLWLLPSGWILSQWDLFHWWCGPLHRFAKAHHITLVRSFVYDPFLRIAVIDAATGTRVRDLGTFLGSFSHYDDLTISLSPDGACLYIPEQYNCLTGIDTKDGHVVRRLWLDGGPYVNQISGITPDGDTVYATFHDTTANRVSLVRWDVHEDRHRVIKSVQGEILNPGTASSRVEPQRFYLVPGVPERTFLQLPSRSLVLRHNVENALSTFEWFTESHPDDMCDLVLDYSYDSYPTPLGRAGRLAIKTQYSGIALVDFNTGELCTILDPQRGGIEPPSDVFRAPFSEVPMHRLVFGYSTVGILVFDANTRSMLTSSMIPLFELCRPDVVRSITPAPDLSSIAAVAFHSNGTGRGTRYIYELFIYDLTPYPALRALEFGDQRDPSESP